MPVSADSPPKITAQRSPGSGKEIPTNELADTKAKTAATTTRNSSRHPKEHAKIHHQLVQEQWRGMAVFTSPKIAKSLAIEQTRSSLRAFEPATLYC